MTCVRNEIEMSMLVDLLFIVRPKGYPLSAPTPRLSGDFLDAVCGIWHRRSVPPSPVASNLINDACKAVNLLANDVLAMW